MEMTAERFAPTEFVQASTLSRSIDLVRRFKSGCPVTDHIDAVEMLCTHFDINAYQVGTTFPEVSNPSDHSKWFVSVSAGSVLDVGEFPPLAESELAAKLTAVVHYNLDTMFLASHAH